MEQSTDTGYMAMNNVSEVKGLTSILGVRTHSTNSLWKGGKGYRSYAVEVISSCQLHFFRGPHRSHLNLNAALEVVQSDTGALGPEDVGHPCSKQFT